MRFIEKKVMIVVNTFYFVFKKWIYERNFLYLYYVRFKNTIFSD